MKNVLNRRKTKPDENIMRYCCYICSCLIKIVYSFSLNKLKFKFSILIWGHNSVLLLLFQIFVFLFLIDIKELVLNVLPTMYIHKNRIYFTLQSVSSAVISIELENSTKRQSLIKSYYKSPEWKVILLHQAQTIELLNVLIAEKRC